MRGLLDFLLTIFVAFALVFGFVKPVVADSRYVGSASMIPTLKLGHAALQKDRILINKLAYDFGELRRGDIVLFEDVEGGDEDLIKRVVAVGGDTVEIRNGVLYLNGHRRAEPYPKHRPKDYSSFGSVTIPKDHIFVMGDNRANSHDSRYFGPVPRDRLIGEAILRYWPVNRAALI